MQAVINAPVRCVISLWWSGNFPVDQELPEAGECLDRVQFFGSKESRLEVTGVDLQILVVLVAMNGSRWEDIDVSACDAVGMLINVVDAVAGAYDVERIKIAVPVRSGIVAFQVELVPYLQGKVCMMAQCMEIAVAYLVCGMSFVPVVFKVLLHHCCASPVKYANLPEKTTNIVHACEVICEEEYNVHVQEGNSEQ